MKIKVQSINHLAALITRIRATLGISQTAMAKGLNIKQSVLSRYENARLDPTPMAPQLLKFWENGNNDIIDYHKGMIKFHEKANKEIQESFSILRGANPKNYLKEVEVNASIIVTIDVRFCGKQSLDSEMVRYEMITHYLSVYLFDNSCGELTGRETTISTEEEPYSIAYSYTVLHEQIEEVTKYINFLVDLLNAKDFINTYTHEPYQEYRPIVSVNQKAYFENKDTLTLTYIKNKE